MKQGFVIPVYNHGATVGAVVKQLAAHDLPIILVDDGSDAATKSALADVVTQCPLAVLVTLPRNRGKGAAVSAGIDTAHGLELSHVLQIDADGQHDADRVGFFLEQSLQHPDAAICGCPLYDESVPLSRKKGRVFGNNWAKIVTLSDRIVDVMCGFRVYPVEPVWRLIHRSVMDQRMGFDIEILVRLHWKNIPLYFHPVSVVYPVGGISHFHAVRDNARISWAFTRLFCGMLLRLPLLLARRTKNA
ncbi:MAG: glycosyltransferase family 2 protein [Treponema sp.]|jgi:glycosyltransferase involved in cell wall biosynthesis|nr:glycosyltransferase family 2 protein [Treponema sp.]